MLPRSLAAKSPSVVTSLIAIVSQAVASALALLAHAHVHDDRSALETVDLAQAPLKNGYTYMMGPGVPHDRLEAIRKALTATYNDPEFKIDADRQVLNIEPVEAGKVKELIADAYRSPREVVDRMRALYAKLFQ